MRKIDAPPPDVAEEAKYWEYRGPHYPLLVTTDKRGDFLYLDGEWWTGNDINVFLDWRWRKQLEALDGRV